MIDANEKIKQKKLLQIKEDELNSANHDVRQLQESYSQHFQQANRFFEELNITYARSDMANVYQSISEDYKIHSHKIMNRLESDQAELKMQRQKIERELEEIKTQKEEEYNEH